MINKFINMIDEKLYFEPQGIHGITHIKRVIMILGLIFELEHLDTTEKTILLYSALYHDIGRTDNTGDFTHGKKSYKKLIDTGLINDIELSKENIKVMRFIIENHNIADDRGRKNINNYHIEDTKRALKLYDIFKDTDGLDRVRIGDLDEKYLRREGSKTLIQKAQELYQDYSESNFHNDIIYTDLFEHLRYLNNLGLNDIKFYDGYVSGVQEKQRIKIYLDDKKPKKLYHSTPNIMARRIIEEGYLKPNEESIKDIKYNKVYMSDDMFYFKHILPNSMEDFIIMSEYVIFEIDTNNYDVYSYMKNAGSPKEWFVWGTPIDIRDVKIYSVNQKNELTEITKEQVFELDLIPTLKTVEPKSTININQFIWKFATTAVGKELRNNNNVDLNFVSAFTDKANYIKSSGNNQYIVTDIVEIKEIGKSNIKKQFSVELKVIGKVKDWNYRILDFKLQDVI